MRGPLLTEPGVLEDGPVLELNGWEAVARHGGAALLRWRADALAAEASGVVVVQSVVAASFRQAVIHVQKSKDATRWDITQAWTAVTPGGRLVVQGENRLGAKSIIGAMARELGREPEKVVSRERSRVGVFTRGEGAG